MGMIKISQPWGQLKRTARAVNTKLVTRYEVDKMFIVGPQLNYGQGAVELDRIHQICMM